MCTAKPKFKYFEIFAVKNLVASIKEDLSLVSINFDKFPFESEFVFNKFIIVVVFFLGKIPKLIPGIDPLKFSQKEIWYFPDLWPAAGVDPLIL